MDKINRTLLDVEEIRSRQEAVERKLLPVVIDGSVSGGGMSFGTVEGKNAAVIIAFDGANAALTFNGVAVADGKNPLVAVISGKGELRLTGNVSKARALIIGAKKINN